MLSCVKDTDTGTSKLLRRGRCHPLSGCDSPSGSHRLIQLKVLPLAEWPSTLSEAVCSLTLQVVTGRPAIAYVVPV